MVQRARATWSVLAWTALLATGCGGGVAGVGSPGSDSGTGGDGGPRPDSGTSADGSGSDSGGGGSSGCPGAEPSTGGTCQSPGIECEYGSNPNPNCNALFRCMAPDQPNCAAGQCLWEQDTSGGICPAPDAGAVCAATYAAVPMNQQCTPEGLACAYAQGTCYCSLGPGPVSAGPPKWYCIATPAGCPGPRPQIGEACSQAGLSCDYGACLGGVELECVDGQWQEQEVPCPV
jgi:hypothetical protein